MTKTKEQLRTKMMLDVEPVAYNKTAIESYGGACFDVGYEAGEEAGAKLMAEALHPAIEHWPDLADEDVYNFYIQMIGDATGDEANIQELSDNEKGE